MKTLRKSLVRALVVGSMVVGGNALATPKDGQADKKFQGSKTAHGHYLNQADQQAMHQKEFHGDPKSLDKPHFSAQQARHVQSVEKAGDARESANRAQRGANPNQFHTTAGFAGAMNRLQMAESRMDQQESRKKPGNDTTASRAESEMGDTMPSGSSTGEKRANAAAEAAKAKVISNDFNSARRQVDAGQKAADAKEQSQLHLSAGKAQQLTQSDRNENSSKDVGSVGSVITPKGPMLGTHNNYFDARERARYSEPIERLGKVHTPSKFYH